MKKKKKMSDYKNTAPCMSEKGGGGALGLVAVTARGRKGRGHEVAIAAASLQHTRVEICRATC